MLRQATGYYLANQGVDHAPSGAYLGHRNIMNTMIYADYVYTQTELRRLII